MSDDMSYTETYLRTTGWYNRHRRLLDGICAVLTAIAFVSVFTTYPDDGRVNELLDHCVMIAWVSFFALWLFHLIIMKVASRKQGNTEPQPGRSTMKNHRESHATT